MRYIALVLVWFVMVVEGGSEKKLKKHRARRFMKVVVERLCHTVAPMLEQFKISRHAVQNSIPQNGMDHRHEAAETRWCHCKSVLELKSVN